MHLDSLFTQFCINAQISITKFSFIIFKRNKTEQLRHKMYKVPHIKNIYLFLDKIYFFVTSLSQSVYMLSIRFKEGHTQICTLHFKCNSVGTFCIL